MVHVSQNSICVDHDLMAWNPFDIRDKTDAAGVFLKLWIVQALFDWESVRSIHKMGSMMGKTI
jgi:hypothetical protein